MISTIPEKYAEVQDLVISLGMVGLQIPCWKVKISSPSKTCDMSDIPMLGLNCRYLLSIRNSGNALNTGIFYLYRDLMDSACWAIGWSFLHNHECGEK